jgi:hypothetical protein
MKWSLTGKTRFALRRTCAVTTFVALNAVPWASATAQTVDVTQDIDFGLVRLYDNSAQHQIQLLANGSYNADPEFIFHRFPALGEVEVSGFTPNTDLKITFTPSPGAALPQNGMGSAFEIINMFTVPPTIKTDGTGGLDFRVGGTLQTDGLGGVYQDTHFLGTITVNVEEDP